MPTDLAAPTPGPAPPPPRPPLRDELSAPAVCPLCKGAGWLKRYANGRDIAQGAELLPCACTRERIAHATWERARAASGLPAGAGALTFGSFRQGFQPEAHGAAVEFADDPQHNWLVLVGDPGTGKTHLLAAIANRLLGTRWHPLYHVVPDLLAHLRGGFDAGDQERRWAGVRDAEILLLDDYGAEQRTQWTDETILRLLDYRYYRRLPTAVATNLTNAEMPPRVASRLADVARCRVITTRVGDYRRSDQRVAERYRPTEDDDA